MLEITTDAHNAPQPRFYRFTILRCDFFSFSHSYYMVEAAVTINQRSLMTIERYTMHAKKALGWYGR